VAADQTILTYLFSDLESSTRLWEEHPEAMHPALARHDAILRDAVEGANGTVVKTTGDGMMAVFSSPADAVAAGLAAQRGLRDEAWEQTGPLRVRMGMHVGESQARAGDWYGPAVNRAARVMAAAHGGQVLLSGPTAAMIEGQLPVGVTLRDLGTHRLKDLAGPEQLFQVQEHGLPDSFPPVATLDLRPNNLPTLTSMFLGREQVLADLRALLDDDDVRLATMTGPGGTGKTRLALQAAAEQVDRFDDGVFFVDLSPERDADAAFAAIVRAVGLGGTGEDAPLHALKRDLRDCRMLLVLDNFEQVTVAATGLVELLGTCPRVKAVVTSREALRVRGERLFPVPPLSLPPSGVVTVDEALASEAVQLFIERAAETRPDFELTSDNVATVAGVCHRLDGLPLAIELAAARMNVFTIEDLHRRLAEQLDVLRGGARDLPERQQTLRSTIEWSTDLLDETERHLLQLLAVFTNATLDAIEETARRAGTVDSVDLIDGVSSLVDKSLVRRVEDTRGHPRFTMLQTIREHAIEHLEADSDRAKSVRDAHAGYYTELAMELRARLDVANRDEVFAELSDELGNLRSAWDHWVRERDVARLNDLIDPLWGWYDARGDYSAAIELAEGLLEVLAIEPETSERVRDEIALQMSIARALLAVRGYTAEVEERIRQAMDRSGASDQVQAFPVLRTLATLQMLRADFRSGVETGRDLLAIADQRDDTSLQADAHLVYGVNTALSVDVNEGIEHLEQSIEYFDRGATGLVRFQIGPSSGVTARTTSAFLLWTIGFPDRALARAASALEVAKSLDHPYSTAYALHHVAVLDLWRQELGSVLTRAEELLGVANAHDYAIWRALGTVLAGTARVGLGEPDEGMAQVERGFLLYRGLRTPPVFWPALLMVRAAACGMAGRIEEGLGHLDEAEETLPEDDFQVSDVWLAQGDLLLALPSPDVAGAEERFERARATSSEAGVRMNHLSALTRLVTLRRGTPGGQATIAELHDVYTSFTEGFSVPQLVAAREVLDTT